MSDWSDDENPNEDRRESETGATTWVTTRDLAKTLESIEADTSGYDGDFRQGVVHALECLRTEYHIDE